MVDNNSTLITLKYEGSSVQNGSIPIEHILSALQGFSGAYAKVVKFKGYSESHQLRLIGLQKGSCSILIEAFELANNLGIPSQIIAALCGLDTNSSIVINIVKYIIDVIKLTKHTENKDYEVKISGNNNMVNIQNFNNVHMDFPIEVFELYKAKQISHDINKIVEPLSKGLIDSAKVIINETPDTNIEEIIGYKDKEFFATEEIEVATTKEVWLEGTINSLTKSTNNGNFILINGEGLPFHLSMNKPQDYYHYFSSKGTVKIKSIVHLDSSLKPIKLEVYDIEEVQFNLFNKN